MAGDFIGLFEQGSTSMKRKSCTLTAVSRIVQSMSRSSHQPGLSGNGPRRLMRPKMARPISCVLASILASVAAVDMKSSLGQYQQTGFPGRVLASRLSPLISLEYPSLARNIYASANWFDWQVPRVVSTLGTGAQSVILQIRRKADGKHYALKGGPAQRAEDRKFHEQAQYELRVRKCSTIQT